MRKTTDQKNQFRKVQEIVEQEIHLPLAAV